MSTPSLPDPAAQTDLRRLVELIKDVRVAFLVTIADGPAAPGAGPHARPMWTHAAAPDAFDGHLWFMTGAEAGKVAELRADRHVLLTYADPSANRYVAVTGVAEVVRDAAMARSLWNIHAQGWWPGGPDDPDLALIRVTPKDAEYWDGPSNTRYMLSLAKAVATGTQVQARGENERIRLD